MTGLTPIGELEEGEVEEGEMEEGEMVEGKIEEGEIVEETPPKLKYELPWRYGLLKTAEQRPRFEPYRSDRRRLSNTANTRERPQVSTEYQRYRPPTNVPQMRSAQQFSPQVRFAQRMSPAQQWQQARKMTALGYARAVSRLRDSVVTREVGAGTSTDPLISWICEPVDRPRGRIEGIEALCRDACKLKGTTRIWVRMGDHSSTRTFSVTAQRRTEKNVSGDDPHVTVYMGNSVEYEYEGHLYLAYSQEDSRIPCRLARPEERRNLQPDDVGDPINLLDRRELREKSYDIGFLPLKSMEPESEDTGGSDTETSGDTAATVTSSSAAASQTDDIVLLGGSMGDAKTRLQRDAAV
ncbi:hypothetical protein BDW62DRAFT_203315 [Aspergillus aurantiobrunneus]